jgi:hypothetical protein
MNARAANEAWLAAKGSTTLSKDRRAAPLLQFL